MRIVLFGDSIGIPQLLERIPPAHVAGAVAASIRPGAIDEVSAAARRAGIPFLVQPRRSSAEHRRFVESVRALEPDLLWVNSYSMLLPPDLLESARLGGINLHGGLLPGFRGANPIQWAILTGAAEAGATLHELTAEIDAGPIIDRRSVPLRFADTWRQVQARVVEAAADLIEARLGDILSGIWPRRPQDPRQARSFPRRRPADGELRLDMPLRAIHDLVRALVAPLPGAFFVHPGTGETVALRSPASLHELARLKLELGPPWPHRDGGALIEPVESSAEGNAHGAPADPLAITFALLDAGTRRRCGTATATVDPVRGREACIAAPQTGLPARFRRLIERFLAEELGAACVRVVEAGGSPQEAQSR